MNRQVSLARVVLALVLLFTGVAAGYSLSIVSAQGDDATIYASVNKWNGATRIVDSDDNCDRSEEAISWSEQGPAGPMGPEGQRGVTGPPGESAGLNVATQTIEIDPLSTSEIIVQCPENSFALMGNLYVIRYDDSFIVEVTDQHLVVDEETGIPVAWSATVQNLLAPEVTAWVLCKQF